MLPRRRLSRVPATIFFIIGVFLLFANVIALLQGDAFGALGVIVGAAGMWLTWPSVRRR